MSKHNEDEEAELQELEQLDRESEEGQKQFDLQETHLSQIRISATMKDSSPSRDIAVFMGPNAERLANSFLKHLSTAELPDANRGRACYVLANGVTYEFDVPIPAADDLRKRLRDAAVNESRYGDSWDINASRLVVNTMERLDPST